MANQPNHPMQQQGSTEEQPDDSGGGGRRRLIFLAIYIIGGLLLLLALGGGGGLFNFGQETVPYSEFISSLEAGEIEQVTIGETQVTWTEPAEGEEGEAVFSAERPPNTGQEQLIDRLDQAGVEYEGVRSPDILQSILPWVIPIVILFLLWRFFMSRMQQGPQQIMGFGQNNAELLQGGSVDVSYEDVGGVDEAKNELEEIVDYLRNPEKYERLGGRVPKGVLLVGPPGTGKTLLARATAGESSVPFFHLSGPEFVEMFVGVGASRVRDLFKNAREAAPCIVFIDELDTIGRARGGAQSVGTHEEREQTLNQLLTEMDGFDSDLGVIIMAATNRPDVLDQALLRPGRFDRQVIVDKPDRKGRLDILKIHIDGVKLADNVDLETVATRTPGFAGAELENLVNEAALLAARREADAVEMQDFNAAIDRVMMGLERRSRALNEEEQEIVAYHELGHAIVASLLPHTDPVHKVSIVPRGIGALGHTLQLPAEDRYLISEPQLHDRIAVMLGGRAAEHAKYVRVSTGASNDLQQVTELARRMVAEFGMSPEIGPVAVHKQQENKMLPGAFGYREDALMGDEIQRKVDSEVRRIVDQNYERAINLLKTHMEILDQLAEELLEMEDMDGDTLQERLEELGAQKVERTPHSLDPEPENVNGHKG